MSDFASGLPFPARNDQTAAVGHEPAAPQVPATADMISSVTRLDRSIKLRRDSDAILINYWLYFFLVSWVTFGIYALVLFFKRIGRIDGFTERKRAYYHAVLEWTERYAHQRDVADVVHHQLADLRGDVDSAYKRELRPIK